MRKPLHSRAMGERGSALTRSVLLLAILAGVVGVVWYTASRIKELNRQLAASERRAMEMNERLREYSAELEAAIERAREARARAEVAEKRAQETEEALRQTERQAESAARQRNRAKQEAMAAEAEALRAKRQVEEIRRRREAELDRMQQALNKIAPTRRTPSGMVLTLADSQFRFDFDSAALRPENREKLARIAGVLLASEGYRLFIDGHTDDVGTEEYNQKLSERRARAVRDYLVKAGVPAELIEVRGFGKTQPLVKAKTKEARARNRRVEIGIVDTIIHYERALRR